MWDHEPHAGIVRGLRNRQRLDRVGNELVPKFKAGDMLYYYNNMTHVGMWRIGVVGFILDTTIADEHLYYSIDPVAQGPTFPKETGVIVAEGNLRTLKWGAWGKANLPTTKTSLPVLSQPLHSLDCVGIDTCSALSVSTEKADFIYIDDSDEAKESVSLRGIGGEQSVVGGRGPLVIATRDEGGNKLYMVDPSGVYLNKGTSSQLRILGQQRMKRFGFDLVQNMKGDEVDYLVHRASGEDYKVQTNIPLITENGILLMATCGVDFTT